jgi:triosephosphate isomerase
VGRKPLVAGNWKMYKTAAEARSYIEQFWELVREEASQPGFPEVVLCVPFTALAAAAQQVGERPIGVFAQNMHHELEGPFTGEVSAPMLLECGARGVVLGHSERRTYFGETDRALALKVPAALAAGLTPILCVGESELQREGGETERTLRHQVGEALAGVADDQLGKVVIAYEPIWAIGTGKRAEASQIEEAAFFIRALVEARSRRAAAELRILYGGSVSERNAAEVFALPNLDGALVGGASLDPARFAQIARAAAG